ncbi:MAG: DUF120 domain-containing protein [Acidilobus sp.]
MRKTFRGVVFSGVGEGEFFINLYAENLRRILGFTPYPGTLNLRVIDDADEFNRALVKQRPKVVEPPKVEGIRLGRVLAYPAALNWTVEVYIVRPEITIYRSDVAEVIADVRLRDLLNLADGSQVEIGLGDP